MESTEVLVIGGGVHGASAAFHLAGRGADVVLVERGGPGSGPTGSSSAITRAFYSNRFLASVAWESIGMFAEFERLTGGHPSGFHRTGAVFLHGEQDRGGVRQAVAAVADIGVDVAVIDRDQVAELLPHARLDDVAVGVHERSAGYADPVLTTQGLAAAARDRGADTRWHSEVTAIEEAGGGWSVTVDGAAIVTERVLVAAGPWTASLVAPLGVELPLTAERHACVSLELDAEVRPGLAVADIAGDMYMRPDGPSRSVAGTLAPTAPVDPDAEVTQPGDAEAVGLARRVVDRFPDLADRIRPIGGWAALYDVSPDWQPVIGEVAPRLFVDAGTSGHGFKLAPALGRHVADLVLDDDVDEGLAAFSPQRFESTTTLASAFTAAPIIG